MFIYIFFCTFIPSLKGKLEKEKINKYTIYVLLKWNLLVIVGK